MANPIPNSVSDFPTRWRVRPVSRLDPAPPTRRDFRRNLRTHEIEGPAMRLAGIGGANRLDRVGGAGRTLVEGTVDEPSTVTINGEPASLRPLPGGSSFLYSKELNLGPGGKRLEIEATDPNGNVARRSYTVSVGGVERTLSHDLNGNVTQEAVAGGKTRVYEWDAINRLTAIQSDATPVSGSWRSEFTYDGQSRRGRIVEKTWSGTAWTVQSDHRYLWCGTEICQKRNSTGATVVAKYYDQGEQQTVGSTTTDYYYTRDHLGSIREVIKPSTNAAGHEIHLRYDYTAWGERVKLSGGADVEWGFTGHHYHAKSGLHLALYRAYDANLGRWLSEDPLGEAGGVNLYGYADNSPINAIDPDGAMPLWLANAIDSDAANAVADFVGGFSNDWLMGIPEKLGAMDGRNKCSDAYQNGELASTIAGLVGGGKGLVGKIGKQMGKGNLLSRLKRGISRLASDNRKWDTVRRTYSNAAGGLRDKGVDLHHWLSPQRSGSSWVNAGFNYVELGAQRNRWMNGSTPIRRLAERALRTSIAGTAISVAENMATSPFDIASRFSNCK